MKKNILDAVHPEFQSQAVSGWIKKGEVKTLPTTNKQFRIHFVGALSLVNMKVFAREYDTIDADSVINFLKDLEKSSRDCTVNCVNPYYAHSIEVTRSPKNMANEEKISCHSFTRFRLASISRTAKYSILNNEPFVGKAPLALVTLRI